MPLYESREAKIKSIMGRKKKQVIEPTPMADYINMRMAQLGKQAIGNRKALNAMVIDATDTVKRKEIHFTDEESHQCALKFKRLLCCLKAECLLFNRYADGLRDHMDGLKGMSKEFTEALGSFLEIQDAFVVLNSKINNMLKKTECLAGDNEEDVTMQNDKVLSDVVETAMNCDCRGNTLDKEYVLVKIPRSYYNTMAISNPYFASLTIYGGQWDERL